MTCNYHAGMGPEEQAQTEAAVRAVWMEYRKAHHDATRQVRTARRNASEAIAAAHEVGLTIDQISRVLAQPRSVIERRLNSVTDQGE